MYTNNPLSIQYLCFFFVGGEKDRWWWFWRNIRRFRSNNTGTSCIKSGIGQATETSVKNGGGRFKKITREGACL